LHVGSDAARLRAFRERSEAGSDPPARATRRRQGRDTRTLFLHRSVDANSGNSMTLRDRLRRLSRLVHSLCRRLEPVAPLLTRLVLGWAFVRTGYGKLSHFERAVEFFGEVGIPLPLLSAALISTLELAGGALLCVGLWTRLFAGLLSCTMLVAILTADRAQVTSALAAGGGYGLIEVVPLVFLLFLLWLVADGGGLISLDRLLARARPVIGEAEALVVRQRTLAARAAGNGEATS
jgi:putative oxidoreductase